MERTTIWPAGLAIFIFILAIPGHRLRGQETPADVDSSSSVAATVALTQTEESLARTEQSENPSPSDPDWLPLSKRPALWDGPGTRRDSMRQNGIDMNWTFLQYYQGLASGDGDHGWEYGDKLFGQLNLDGEKLGWQEGLSISMIGEFNFGQNVNNRGGTIIPVNTSLAFPQNGGPGGDLSLLVTQQLSERTSISIGKFDMVDAPSRTPLIGGGGIDTFWNTGLAAPITGVVPPYVTGASLNVTTEPLRYTLMIYDPRNAQQSTGLEGWGEDGVTGLLSITYPTKFAGRPLYQGIKIVGSSREGIDFEDIPQLVFPPGSEPALGTERGSYYIGYSIQHFLWQNPGTPDQGWGFFGQAGVADANPNFLQWQMLAGIGGNSPSPNHSNDRFGIGYFLYSFSDELTDGLQLLGFEFGDEQGVEMFYNYEVRPWFHIVGDVQFIRPGNQNRDSAIFAGLSAQVKF